MLGLIGLVTVSAGATLSQMAQRMPSREAMLEGGAGALLIAGLAIIGSGLPFIL